MTKPATTPTNTPENTHAGHLHVENQRTVWNSDGDVIALFFLPGDSALVVFTYQFSHSSRMCSFSNRAAAEAMYESVVASWDVDDSC